MALDVKLISPDGVTTITLKAAKVAQRIQRKVNNSPIPGNRSIDIDLRQAKKQFTITAEVTASGTIDKAQYEALEDAALNWASQSSNRGRTKFEYSTKNDVSAKTYRVRWLSLDMVEDVERSPGSFIVTIVLEEADIYSTSGGTA